MMRSVISIAVASLVLPGLAGCSGTSALSTSSIFGGGGTPKAEPVAAQPAAPDAGDPTTRALQVGSTAARAVKCGYNFDPVRLKESFMASETALGADPATLARANQIYDVAFNGVSKAAATEPNYCNDARTKEIKTSLSRHLAGDYTPSPLKKAAQEEDGGMFNWSF